MNNSFVTLVVCVLLAVGCGKDNGGTSSSGTTGVTAEPNTPSPVVIPEPPQKTAFDVVREQKTLSDTLAIVIPLMEDTFDKQSMGSILLTVWSSENLKWSDVNVISNETSFARVKKDSNEERAKKLCLTGRIIQIARQNSSFGKIYSGLIMANGNLYNFAAVNSTGDLEDGSIAKYCGIVTGTYDYKNSGGGTGHAVDIVGMFDLPENRL